MLADYGTKPLTAVQHKRFKYWSTGASYLPKQGDEHYDLLQMQYYECNLVEMLKDFRLSHDGN